MVMLAIHELLAIMEAKMTLEFHAGNFDFGDHEVPEHVEYTAKDFKKSGMVSMSTQVSSKFTVMTE
jgi:hypothetical protein